MLRNTLPSGKEKSLIFTITDVLIKILKFRIRSAKIWTKINSCSKFCVSMCLSSMLKSADKQTNTHILCFIISRDDQLYETQVKTLLFNFIPKTYFEQKVTIIRETIINTELLLFSYFSHSLSPQVGYSDCFNLLSLIKAFFIYTRKYSLEMRGTFSFRVLKKRAEKPKYSENFRNTNLCQR